MVDVADGEAVMVTSLRSLLRLTECRTLADLETHVEKMAGLDDDCQIIGMGLDGDASDGIEIVFGTRGSYHEYPFELDDLYAAAVSLEEVRTFVFACESLEDEIAMVEGIRVVVTIDYWCDERAVRLSAERREVCGEIIQTVPEYPYVRAMSRSRTFDEWKSIRFDRQYAGLDVGCTGFRDGVEVSEPTLSELRRRASQSQGAAAPTIGERRCAQCGTPMVPIVYGFPGPEMWDAAERGEIVLGGCVMSPFPEPTRSCSCGLLTATITDNER